MLFSISLALPTEDVDECSFVASIFSGGEYAEKSSEAHTVLGLFIMLVVITWALKERSMITLSRAYTVSGLLHVSMGLYLYLWVFVLLSPDNVSNGRLYQYSSNDFLQIQHTAISGLLVAAGLVEVNYGLSAFESGSWHAMYAFHMVLVGIIFLMHPQKTRGGEALHIYLGVSLVLGSIALHSSKKLGFPSSLAEDWYLPVAGFWYTIAFAILVVFEEHATRVHHGHLMECQASGHLTVGSWILSIFSSCFCIGYYIYYRLSRNPDIGINRSEYTYVEALGLPSTLTGMQDSDDF